MSSGPRVGSNLAANGSEQRSSFVGLRRSRRSLLRLATGAGVLTMIATACGGSSEKTVEINDELVFQPTKMTVKVGESVTWRNTGKGMVHTATCDPTKVGNPNHVARPDGADPWDSGLIQRDKSWIHVFTIAGEYRYCCIPHESAGMIGTIVVIDEA
jgi:plastocyanin